MSVYTVEFESQRKPTVAEWVAMERGQISEFATRVNNALLSVVARLDGRAGLERDPTQFAALTDDLYRHLLKSSQLDRVLELHAAAPVTAAKKAKAKKPGSGGGGKWEEKKTMVDSAGNAVKVPKKLGEAGEDIRAEQSKKKLSVIGAEIYDAYSKALAVPKGVNPYPRVLAALLRFLRHEVFEVRALVLMVFAHHLRSMTGADSPQAATFAANELDAAVQRFLEHPQGRSYIDPSRTSDPSSAMKTDLSRWIANLRTVHPFNGVRLATLAPRIVWSTRYDSCLTEAPIRARENQRRTIEVLHNLALSSEPFLFMNRAPPGAGKSTLLVPISALLVSMGRDESKDKRELYVCAGQGRFGVTQFAQAVYSAGIPFSIVYVEEGKLEVRKQYSNELPSRIFLGTADAICLLAKHSDNIAMADVLDLLRPHPEISAADAIPLLKRSRRLNVPAALELLREEVKNGSNKNAVDILKKKKGRTCWVVIDEPTYAADIAGSRPCREIMTLVASLPHVNRRVIMLGATLPPPEAIPSLVAHCGTAHTVNGGLDSVQIACDVRTLGGRELSPHTGSTTSAEVRAVQDQVMTRPFLGRMYTIASLDRMRQAIAACGVSMRGAPNLEAKFSTANGLKPSVVVEAASEMLGFLAEQSPEVIEKVCALPRATHPPVSYGTLVTSEPPENQVLIVTTEPLEFMLQHFKPILAELKKEKVDIEAMYAEYANDCASISAAAEATARRRGAGEAKAGEEYGSGKKVAFTETRKSGKGSADGTVDAGIPDELDRAEAKLKFPEWAQIGTAAHRGRFGASKTSDTPGRVAIRPETVKRGAVSAEIQALLLCGVGILSSRAVKCTEYAAEVWRRAAANELSILITDHSACYGANMLLGTVIITEEFARVASTPTIEQAGGRLCRVGLTYRGTLILPDEIASQMFADIRNGTSTAVEAANMELEFAAALARH